jgi:hypothetical protein
MNQSPTESQNPYSSPQTVVDAVGTRARTWRNALVALVGVALPCVLIWVFMEVWFLVSLLPGQHAHSGTTPNPQPAPWYFVSGVEALMVMVNIRLAIFAARWAYIVYLSWIVWPLIGPPLFLRRNDSSTSGRTWSSKRLFVASLLIGTFLSWPWLIVMLAPNWLGP